MNTQKKNNERVNKSQSPIAKFGNVLQGLTTDGKMHSSLMFQMLLYFHWYYVLLYNLAGIGFMIFKSNYLFYPTSYFVCDLLIFMTTFVLELLRLHIGKYGNLTEGQIPVLACLALTIPATLGTVYALVWQTYLLNVELILTSITFVFHGLQFLYCILLGVGFKKGSAL